jgi:DNA (cytosine-5)-methyltransferase 1
MATINFYLDKADKKGFAPIHLRVNCEGSQIKVATGEKIKIKDFDKDNQLVKNEVENSNELNHYLTYLKDRTNDLFTNGNKKRYTNSEIKRLLSSYINNYKATQKVSIIKEQLPLDKKSFTFVDLFAGAGGFSEGFLQAEAKDKIFDFIVGNDINENCELTHIVRYNHQLGLDAEFLCQDITEPDFLDNLLAKINHRKIDVVCGGPPCQSFSLAGKRKKFDKKDDLFAHYLKVIKVLQPKYFVMENVKGILTKEKGKIKELILNEINSIIDIKEIPKVETFINALKKTDSKNDFLIDCCSQRIHLEQFTDIELETEQEKYIKNIESKFRQITPKIVDYQTSKTDERISTIRHGFNLLLRNKQWEKLRRAIIKEKDYCNIDNDYFVQPFHDFLTVLDVNVIIEKIETAFKKLVIPKAYQKDCDDILEALKIYTLSFDDTLTYIKSFCDKSQNTDLEKLIEHIRLYKIEAPFVANASNYGVPQNRERVLFIGCRKDQKFIAEIPATVTEKEKVSIFEAIYDLDFVGNAEEAHHYETVDIKRQFNACPECSVGTPEKMQQLLKQRAIDGMPKISNGKTFAEWSKTGRLKDRFKHIGNPFYVRNAEALKNGEKFYDILHNHKTSNQGAEVIERLEIIRKKGDYKQAQTALNACGLASKKRNYTVLKPERQSPTIMTSPDDYIHYSNPRGLTVREMARLQSFDDDFVFQGKRSTGGNKRKTEVPQFTLVGNAVPPLMARAVAMEILKNIK